ncbi:MAG TPA: ABC transporter ATP-binding protein [Gammaproteobacteria bacterium]|nr:ABC transporter ATP-binding protein [Gammaproteobacteria bacterium]
MTLAAVNVEVSYGTRTAVRATTLTLEPGNLIALVGPNGAGKSTLLRALAGLVAHRGVVTWQGAALAKLDGRTRARTAAYLPQYPPVHWPLAARELVALGRLPHRAYAASENAADAAAVAAAMRQTDTLDFAARSVNRLSVGERARVLLARALAVEAPVLLADEPIAMLDPYHQLEVLGTLRAYAAGGDAASSRRLVVVVLHDLGLAARFCDRVLLMDAGAVVGDGVPDATLGAQAIRAHYRVEPFIARHDDEPLIVPWRPIGGRN